MNERLQHSLRKITAGCRLLSAARGLVMAILCGFIAVPAMTQDARTSRAPEFAGDATENQPLQNHSMSISSVDEADRLLEDAEKERVAVNARYQEEQSDCQTRFFVTSCIDDARERQRLALKKVRSVEVQANAYKRAAKVERRDKALERKAPGDRGASPPPHSSARIGTVLREERDIVQL